MKQRTIVMPVVMAFLAVFSVHTVYGQANEDRRAMMKEHMMDRLISELDLTDTEEEQFVPVYEEYLNEVKEMQDDEIKNIIDGKKMTELTDEETDAVIQASFDKKQQMLDLRKQYYERFTEVIPVKKVAKLYHLENRTKDKIKDRWQGRKKSNRNNNENW